MDIGPMDIVLYIPSINNILILTNFGVMVADNTFVSPIAVWGLLEESIVLGNL